MSSFSKLIILSFFILTSTAAPFVYAVEEVEDSSGWINVSTDRPLVDVTGSGRELGLKVRVLVLETGPIQFPEIQIKDNSAGCELQERSFVLTKEWNEAGEFELYYVFAIESSVEADTGGCEILVFSKGENEELISTINYFYNTDY